jgi:2'-5' RNA ligase
VTLARMRGVRQGAVARFLEENGDLRLEPFAVTRFVLLSARPGSGGPPYGIEAEYPFADASSVGQSKQQA